MNENGQQKNFNIPEIDEQIEEKSILPTENKSSTRSIPKTIGSWCLVLLGITVILVTMVSNLKKPNYMNFKYRARHNANSKKHKNNYILKYKSRGKNLGKQ